ncbi:uncharacterized protein [Physcomitrium patens]|uniref:uncharacterized protein n=1 Tax=Physcomitrium patens TaxID=3218 RepID=UPI003CCE07E6
MRAVSMLLLVLLLLPVLSSSFRDERDAGVECQVFFPRRPVEPSSSLSSSSSSSSFFSSSSSLLSWVVCVWPSISTQGLEELGVLLRCNQASNSFLESLGRVSSAKAVIRILSYCYSEKLWLRSLIAVATKPKHWNPQRLVRMQSGTFGVYLDCAERHKDMVIFGI